MPQIQLLDGKKIPFSKSINGFDLTKKISKSLEKTALIMEVNGQLKDLSYENYYHNYEKYLNLIDHNKFFELIKRDRPFVDVKINSDGSINAARSINDQEYVFQPSDQEYG